MDYKQKMVNTLNKTKKQLRVKSLPTGATVILVDPIRKNKFEPKYIGPYTIARRARNGAYVLRDGTGDILDRHVPIDQLKLLSKRQQNNNNIYEVQHIISHRGEADNYEYEIKWKGYNEITQSNFLDDGVIKKYWSTIKSN
jgi:hypothetical protein